MAINGQQWSVLKPRTENCNVFGVVFGAFNKTKWQGKRIWRGRTNLTPQKTLAMQTWSLLSDLSLSLRSQLVWSAVRPHWDRKIKEPASSADHWLIYLGLVASQFFKIYPPLDSWKFLQRKHQKDAQQVLPARQPNELCLRSPAHAGTDHLGLWRHLTYQECPRTGLLQEANRMPPRLLWIRNMALANCQQP